jgi:hypothetical protein
MDWDTECECGSTENLSKHITTTTGHVSLTHAMCGECRKKMRESVRHFYNELQPWFKPIDEQRAYAKSVYEGENHAQNLA